MTALTDYNRGKLIAKLVLNVDARYYMRRPFGQVLRLGTSIVLLAIFNLQVLSDEFTVVASIKPVHSIVSAIMAGVGEPHLVMKGSASPHTFNLRPSDARALDKADVVFQIGPMMEASLADIMWTLAARAKIVSLSHASDLVRLSFREGGAFELHEHAHHGDGDHPPISVQTNESENVAPDGHSHAADLGYIRDQSEPIDVLNDDLKHTKSASLLENDVDESFDMHIWLDPKNSGVMARVIASVLIEQDHANSASYSSNLEKFLTQMEVLETELDTELAGLEDRSFIVFHDAYRYFEDRFNLTAVGSAQVIPGVTPGVRRILELQQRIKDLDVVCVFSEPQFDSKLVNTIVEGSDVRIGELDPLGARLDDGPSLYPKVLRNMSSSFKDCLQPS